MMHIPEWVAWIIGVFGVSVCGGGIAWVCWLSLKIVRFEEKLNFYFESRAAIVDENAEDHRTIWGKLGEHGMSIRKNSEDIIRLESDRKRGAAAAE